MGQGKHYSTKLLISCELRKIFFLILQTPTLVPLFLQMFFQAFEHLTCTIVKVLAPTYYINPFTIVLEAS
jgi:hypothetical protein